MAAAKNHPVLIGGGLAAAALAGYEFLYKPWKLQQDLAAIPGATGGGGGVYMPGPAYSGSGPSYPSTSPLTMLAPAVPVYGGSNNPQPSNLDPGSHVPGPIGGCMHIRGNNQETCTAHVNDAIAGYHALKEYYGRLTTTETATSQAWIANLTNQVAAVAQQMNTATAAGQGGTVAALKAQLNDLEAQLSAAKAHLAGLPGDLARVQGQMATYEQNFLAHTGYDIRQF